MDSSCHGLFSTIGTNTFRHVQEFVEDVLLVSDDDIKRYGMPIIPLQVKVWFSISEETVNKIKYTPCYGLSSTPALKKWLTFAKAEMYSYVREYSFYQVFLYFPGLWRCCIMLDLWWNLLVLQPLQHCFPKKSQILLVVTLSCLSQGAI